MHAGIEWYKSCKFSVLERPRPEILMNMLCRWLDQSFDIIKSSFSAIFSLTHLQILSPECLHYLHHWYCLQEIPMPKASVTEFEGNFNRSTVTGSDIDHFVVTSITWGSLPLQHYILRTRHARIISKPWLWSRKMGDLIPQLWFWLDRGLKCAEK